MQAHIFAEESNTTADCLDKSVKEYYEGLFSIVSGLDDDLSELTESHLHILSEEYGVVEAEEKIVTVSETKQTPVGTEKMTERAREELLSAAAEADVMVVLLSTDIFQNTVTEVWDELVDAAKPESIWCLGAARSSLDELDFDGLKSKGCTVLTYQRVGVARIGSDTREELIEMVERRAAQ